MQGLTKKTRDGPFVFEKDQILVKIDCMECRAQNSLAVLIGSIGSPLWLLQNYCIKHLGQKLDKWTEKGMLLGKRNKIFKKRLK